MRKMQSFLTYQLRVQKSELHALRYRRAEKKRKIESSMGKNYKSSLINYTGSHSPWLRHWPLKMTPFSFNNKL